MFNFSLSKIALGVTAVSVTHNHFCNGHRINAVSQTQIAASDNSGSNKFGESTAATGPHPFVDCAVHQNTVNGADDRFNDKPADSPAAFVANTTIFSANNLQEWGQKIEFSNSENHSFFQKPVSSMDIHGIRVQFSTSKTRSSDPELIKGSKIESRTCTNENFTHTVDYIHQARFFGRYCEWEIKIKNLFVREIAAGDRVLDVGAWVASTAMLFGQLTSRNTSIDSSSGPLVVAVEGNPTSFQEAQQHVAANELKGHLKPNVVSIVNAVLGDTGPKMTKIENTSNSADRVGDLIQNEAEAVAVPMLTLNSIVANNEFGFGGKKIDFIKVDIEGYEVLLVPSLEFVTYLKTNRPKIVVSLHPRTGVEIDELKTVVDTLAEIYGRDNCFDALSNSAYDYDESYKSKYSGGLHNSSDIFCKIN